MKIKTVIPLILILSNPCYGELLDPRTRDEDISGTEVSVSIAQDGAGLYRYEYTLKSSPENHGKVGTMYLDVSCPGPVEPRSDLSQLGLSTGSIALGYHVPVAVSGGFTLGVNEQGSVQWGRQLDPGEVGTALVVSPYGPAPRQYTLEPSMGPQGYDYDSYRYAPGLYPWIPDFTVSGFTRGPACPGNEEPIGQEPSDQQPRFAGTLYPNESEYVNGLLTYSTPTRDRFHASSESNEVELTIHYSSEIDPKSFRAMPQKHNLRGLFNPQPGTTETVRIRLDAGKNKIQLQVKPKTLHPHDRRNNEYHGRGPETDQDEFEIRVKGERKHGNRAKIR